MDSIDPRFSSPKEFVGRHLYADRELFARAPWFQRDFVNDHRLNESYCNGSQKLPGGLPLQALASFEWQVRIAVGDAELGRFKREWVNGRWALRRRRRMTRGDLVAKVATKLKLLRGRLLQGVSSTLDIWVGRTAMESNYAEALSVIRPTIQRWSALGVVADVHKDAIIWRERRLRRDYRVAKKSDFVFWSSTVRYERRVRCETGYFVQWHQPEFETMAQQARERKYILVPHWWAEWELPWGMWAELPPVFAYVGSEVLANPSSSWWVVHCTGWALSVAEYVVWDAFDTYRLWWVPPRILKAWSQLGCESMRLVLGEDGYDDWLAIVSSIKAIKWTEVPPGNQQRAQSQRGGYCRGRDTAAGDYVWYDPFNHCVLDREEALRRRTATFRSRAARAHRNDERNRGDCSAANIAPRTFADVEKLMATTGVSPATSHRVTSPPSGTSRTTASSSQRHGVPASQRKRASGSVLNIALTAQQSPRSEVVVVRDDDTNSASRKLKRPKFDGTSSVRVIRATMPRDRTSLVGYEDESSSEDESGLNAP